jgi:ribose transport system substrate-binding protein
MKWVYKVVFGLLTTLMVVSAAGSLFYYSRVNDNSSDETPYEFRIYPEYCFSLILNTQDDIYWEEFKQGAIEAAKHYNVAIEFNEVSELKSQSQIVEYIHIANQSKMDGIIVAGESTDEYNAAIMEAAESGINVVVGNFDTSGSNRVAYVGTNNYEYGADAASLILQTQKMDAEVAVILSNQSSENVSNPSNMNNGMSKGGVNPASTLYRTSDLLGAEDQIRTTLNEHPNIDVILCTNAKDTVSAAHVIIERNLVGKVAIVGTGVTREIIDYIRKGVIFGVLDRNGYRAGYQSVRVLYESMGDTFKTNYMDINTSTYTADNISSYVKP